MPTTHSTTRYATVEDSISTLELGGYAESNAQHVAQGDEMGAGVDMDEKASIQRLSASEFSQGYSTFERIGDDDEQKKARWCHRDAGTVIPDGSVTNESTKG